MGKIVLNSELASVLRGCTKSAELCDSDGNVIGYFEPPIRLYEPGEIPEFDEEELKRREKRWLGIPSSEVRRRLEQER